MRVSDRALQARPSGPHRVVSSALLQRQAAGPDGRHAIPGSVHETLSAPGQALEGATRAEMGLRLGHDFSQVRVHTDAQAAASAQAVHALAYTVGQDIVFANGQYAPGTPQGQRLLAHELTHVVQQSGAPTAPGAGLKMDDAASPAEREAGQVAERVMQGDAGPVLGATEPGTLQRQEAEDEPRRLRLPEYQFGQGIGYQPPRLGFDVPQLRLDPEIEAQMRAIQATRGLLSIDYLTSAASRLSSASLTLPPPSASGAGGPTPGPLAGGSPQPAGGLGTPPPQPAPPVVPAGAGPATPRAASVGDLLKAVLRVPAVQTSVTRLQTEAESQLRSGWRSLSTGERVLVISQGVVLSAGVIAGIASDPDATRFVLQQVEGRAIPLPGIPVTFQFNLTGPDQRVQIGLDVGQLLPASLGFGPSK